MPEGHGEDLPGTSGNPPADVGSNAARLPLFLPPPPPSTSRHVDFTQLSTRQGPRAGQRPDPGTLPPSASALTDMDISKATNLQTASASLVCCINPA